MITIPVYFDLKDYVVNRREDTNYYMQESYKGKIINIRLDVGLYNLANTQGKKAKKLTQESLLSACEGALREGNNYGMFEIYLDDKGVFNIGREI